MMRPLALVLALVVVLLAGCSSGGGDDGPDGHYVNYRWGTSQRSCVNDSCTYGQNAESFSIELACRVQPTLSWDAKGWVHGVISATVLDDAGAEAAKHVLSADGHGSQVVAGKAGTWTLKGATGNANGNAEIRLACV